MAGAAQADRAGYRVAVLRDPMTPLGMASFGAIQSAAPALRVELRPIDVHDVEEIERAVAAFAVGPNGGLIVPPTALAILHRKPIIALAAQHRLPAIYAYRSFVSDGGLIAYLSLSSGARPATLIASSRARSLATFRSRHRRSMSWSSMLRPPRRSVFQCRNQCCRAPMR